jgi:hypothetical protein
VDHLKSGQHFTRRGVLRQGETVDQRIAVAQQECTADGCTASPDLNFVDCCNSHDIAYCRGGTENDRLAADQALYNCIRARTNRFLAAIYYHAVRAYGPSHFNYTGATPGSANPTTPDPSKRCHVKVRLESIRYEGK